MLKILTLATATAVALGSTAFAASRVERVAFASHGQQIVGDLYLPGGLGICASSGYMVTAAAKNAAIKSLALVAPWLHDAEVVEQTYGGKDGIARLEAVGDAAEAAYRRTDKQAFLPAASLTDERAIMFKVPYYTEAGRGMIPAWRNEADPAFWRGWLTFDAIQPARRLHQPLLMVH
ncbi:MAG: hypothetical protein E5Y60_29570, partial [Mesorhizobium sp.]